MTLRKSVLLAATSLSLAAAPALAQDVATLEDDEWISLAGTVAASSGDDFTLHYNGEYITVEMDQYDAYEADFLVPGDQVTVTGEVDNDFFERTTIDASSVYVDKLATYYYADPEEEQAGYYAYPVARYADDDEWLGLSGTVTAVDDEELMLNTGGTLLTVDTSDLLLPTLAEAGDRVSVYGRMDDSDLFEGRELEAQSITILATS